MPDWVDELNPDDRAQWDDFVNHFRRDALEKIAGSGIFLSIVPSSEHFDVKFATELGTAIFFDKPLIIVTAPGATIPAKLRMIADHVIDADLDTEEGRLQIAQGLQRIAEEESR